MCWPIPWFRPWDYSCICLLISSCYSCIYFCISFAILSFSSFKSCTSAWYLALALLSYSACLLRSASASNSYLTAVLTVPIKQPILPLAYLSMMGSWTTTHLLSFLSVMDNFHGSSTDPTKCKLGSFSLHLGGPIKNSKSTSSKKLFASSFTIWSNLTSKSPKELSS